MALSVFICVQWFQLLLLPLRALTCFRSESIFGGTAVNRNSWIKSFACCLLIAASVVAMLGRRARAQQQQDTKLPQRAQEYAGDQARYQAAKQRYDDATAQIVAAREAAGEQYRNSPEYVAAEKAVDDTYRAYSERKRQVTSGAREKDPRYVELAKQVAAVDAKLAEARKNPATPYDQFTDLYNEKATFTKQLKALDDDAISESGANDVKRVWDAATAQLQQMQSNQRQAVEQSPQVQNALAAAAQAKAQMDEVGVALAGSQAAYNHAADLQTQQDEYLRRYPPSNYSPYSWYGNYGGWGYYSGGGYGWPVVGGDGGLR
jgi:chromosome segregation ATPase